MLISSFEIPEYFKINIKEPINELLINTCIIKPVNYYL